MTSPTASCVENKVNVPATVALPKVTPTNPASVSGSVAIPELNLAARMVWCVKLHAPVGAVVLPSTPHADNVTGLDKVFPLFSDVSEARKF